MQQLLVCISLPPCPSSILCFSWSVEIASTPFIAKLSYAVSKPGFLLLGLVQVKHPGPRNSFATFCRIPLHWPFLIRFRFHQISISQTSCQVAGHFHQRTTLRSFQCSLAGHGTREHFQDFVCLERDGKGIIPHDSSWWGINTLEKLDGIISSFLRCLGQKKKLI